jgi:hypothetical protein
LLLGHFHEHLACLVNAFNVFANQYQLAFLIFKRNLLRVFFNVIDHLPELRRLKELVILRSNEVAFHGIAFQGQFFKLQSLCFPTQTHRFQKILHFARHRAKTVEDFLFEFA